MSQSDGDRLGAMISNARGRVIDAAGMIKLYGGTGCLSRSDRLAKYNQLLRIEEELDRRSAGGGMRLLRIK